jgi:hypothetical protein
MVGGGTVQPQAGPLWAQCEAYGDTYYEFPDPSVHPSSVAHSLLFTPVERSGSIARARNARMASNVISGVWGGEDGEVADCVASSPVWGAGPGGPSAETPPRRAAGSGSGTGSGSGSGSRAGSPASDASPGSATGSTVSGSSVYSDFTESSSDDDLYADMRDEAIAARQFDDAHRDIAHVFKALPGLGAVMARLRASAVHKIAQLKGLGVEGLVRLGVPADHAAAVMAEVGESSALSWCAHRACARTHPSLDLPINHRCMHRMTHAVLSCAFVLLWPQARAGRYAAALQ